MKIFYCFLSTCHKPQINCIKLKQTILTFEISCYPAGTGMSKEWLQPTFPPCQHRVQREIFGTKNKGEGYNLGPSVLNL
jgi:hypothetical protein